MPPPIPPFPRSISMCFNQKEPVDELSRPSSPRWSSSSASAASFMTGAVRLNTFPPWSSTKVVVRRDEGERDGRPSKTLHRDLVPFPPRPSLREIGLLTEGSAVAQNRASRPKPFGRQGHAIQTRIEAAVAGFRVLHESAEDYGTNRGFYSIDRHGCRATIKVRRRIANCKARPGPADEPCLSGGLARRFAHSSASIRPRSAQRAN
jgi:hypothetical protein